MIKLAKPVHLNREIFKLTPCPTANPALKGSGTRYTLTVARQFVKILHLRPIFKKDRMQVYASRKVLEVTIIMELLSL